MGLTEWLAYQCRLTAPPEIDWPHCLTSDMENSREEEKALRVIAKEEA